MTALKVGFHPPEQCVRGRTDCRSLAQIISTEGGADDVTFVCCGEALGPTPDPRDRWTFCHRSMQSRAHCEGVDLRFSVDEQDMSHIAAVLQMGLAMAISGASPLPAKSGLSGRQGNTSAGKAETGGRDEKA